MAKQASQIISSPNVRTDEIQNTGNFDDDKYCNVATFEITDDVKAVATHFGLNLEVSTEVRLDRAAQNISNSVQYMLAAGIDLLSLRAECEHGEFRKMLESRGFEVTMAHRAMSYAQLILTCPESERSKLLALPKMKVLALAKADPEVLQDLFENEEDFKDTTALSVRELRLRIRELQAQKANMEVELEEAENTASAWREKAENMEESRVKTGGSVPIVVQDTRLECAALFKKAELSIDDMGRLIEELFANPGTFGEHELPVARNLYFALGAINGMVTSCRARLAQEYGESLGDEIGPADMLSPEERQQAAIEYKALTGEHDYDKETRAWEREMDRPAGRGRPRNKPEKK